MRAALAPMRAVRPLRSELLSPPASRSFTQVRSSSRVMVETTSRMKKKPSQ